MITTHNDIISLVKTYTKDLYSYAINKVPQKELAEDLVQDTFLSAYQSYENYKGKQCENVVVSSPLSNSANETFRAVIVNQSGSIVKNKKLQVPKGLSNYNFETGDLLSGYYWLQVINDLGI